MYAGGRQPIEFTGAMVDRVKSPHPAAVKPPVCPITDEVANENHFDGLQPESLPGQQRVPCVQHRLDIVDVSPVQQDKNDRHTNLRYRFRQEWRQEPISEVDSEAAAPVKAKLAWICRKLRFDHPEYCRQQGKGDKETADSVHMHIYITSGRLPRFHPRCLLINVLRLARQWRPLPSTGDLHCSDAC